MNHALFIGRVGALAVALGIGAAVAGMPCVAWAEPEAGSDSSDATHVSSDPTSSDSGGVSSGDAPDAGADNGDVGDAGDTGDTDDATGAMKVESSGGAITSMLRDGTGKKSVIKDRDADPPKRRSLNELRNAITPSPPRTTTRTTTHVVNRSQSPDPSGLRVAPAKDPDPQTRQWTPVTSPMVPPKLSAPDAPVTVSAAPKPVKLPGVSRVLSLMALAPTADDKAPAPADSPLLLAFLAAGRRVSQQASVSDESGARTVDSVENSLMMTAAAVTVAPTVGAPNPVTGAVSGSLNGHTITSQPVSGTVTVNGGTYTYTPSVPARLRAATTTQPDYDSFGVAMSGQPASTVTVPIFPAVLSNQSSIPVAGQPALASPTGLAVNGAYAYVTNQATNSNTVSVINTATGAVVKTITVGSQPSAVAINPAAKLAYVANRASGTVSVINTDTNTVVGSAIRVGTSPQDVAVNVTGTPVVVVANNGGNSVSIIEPTLNNKVTTVGLGVVSAPTAVALSADGSRAYVTHRTISGGGAVSVINTATKKVISTTTVGSSPQDVVVSETKVYVANSNSGSVSVINTAANNSVTTINVGSSPTSLAVSPDGSMVVVARSTDNIVVIDTKTNTVIGAAHLLDTTAPDGGHVVAFDSTGRVLVTDAADHTVRVVGLARGNTAPIATAAPTVEMPDVVKGTVSGVLNIKDPEEDPLYYSVASQPVSSTITGTQIGSVSFTPAGAYTFTPTQAARDKAAQTSMADMATFTVRATDSLGATKDVPITVTVAPTPAASQLPVTVTAITVDTYPTAVVVQGNNAFVYGGDVMWTIDTRTNTVTDSVALYNEPPAVSPDGTRRYEAGYMSVSVVDNQTGAVIDTVDLPNCDYCGYGWSAGVQELAVSPDGKRLYARHAYAVDFAPTVSAVTVIDTSTNEVIGTAENLYAKDLEIAADGRVYAVDEDYWYADVNVYDKDMRYLDTIRLSSYTGSSLTWPTTFARSSDGKRAFAHVYDFDGGGAMTVSVIDTDPASPTYNKETYLTERYSAVSPDGSRLYVPEPDGRTVTVYDTATNTVIGSFITDNGPNETPRGITVAPNGTIYIADPGDNKVYAVTVGAASPL